MTSRESIQRSAKDGLIATMQAWDRLMQTMASAPKAAYASKQDANGWTALDHMAHVAAWERSRLNWLQGRPRFEGLGVSSQEFKLGYDDLNEIVRARTQGQGYDEIMDAAQVGHQAMMDEIRTFDPDDVPRSGGIDSEEIANIGAELTENLADHYDAHREYIERILAS
jgi:hypothetical protein